MFLCGAQVKWEWPKGGNQREGWSQYLCLQDCSAESQFHDSPGSDIGGFERIRQRVGHVVCVM